MMPPTQHRPYGIVQCATGLRTMELTPPIARAPLLLPVIALTMRVPAPAINIPAPDLIRKSPRAIPQPGPRIAIAIPPTISRPPAITSRNLDISDVPDFSVRSERNRQQ